MTRVLALQDTGTTMPDWSLQGWALVFVLLLLWAFVVERRRNIRAHRHVHYFSDADGACQTPGCTTVRRNRRSTP